MFGVVPKEGPRAPLFYFGLLIFTLCAGSLAQDVQQSDLERCASLSSTALKLACFESLAAAGKDGAAPEAATSQESTEPPQTVEAAEVGSSTAADVDAAPAASVNARESTLPVDDSETETKGIPDDFGIEQLDVPDESETSPATVNATVVKVEQGRNKVLYFSFENGQVWRQIEGRRFSYPKNEPFAVVITIGIMGDYRLRLANGGSMTRIRRVR